MLKPLSHLLLGLRFIVNNIKREALFTFVGEKCCSTTVGVGLTFQPFVGATFISLVGPTIFVSQQMKTVVGPNSFPPTKVLKVCWENAH